LTCTAAASAHPEVGAARPSVIAVLTYDARQPSGHAERGERVRRGSLRAVLVEEVKIKVSGSLSGVDGKRSLALAQFP
jgi:hypothetical protein